VRISILNWRDIYHPHAGGAEVCSHEQAKGLASRGHDVTLFTARYRGSAAEDWIDGYRVLRRGDRFSVYPRTALRLRRHDPPEVPDVVLEHVTGLPWYAPVWSPAPTVAYFHHVIGRTYFRELAPPLSAIGWWAERYAASVYRGRPSFCPGPGSLRVFETLGYRAVDFVPLPPGLPPGACGPPGRKTPNPSLAMVGRIKHYKRADLSIAALARLRPEFPDLTLDIVGPDPDALCTRLAALAESLGVADRVRFHGRVSEAAKREILGSAWVNLIPSDQEGWGLTVLEAAACGTPSVGSNIQGLTDSLLPGVTGFTFRQGDAIDFAGVLRQLLSDDVGRRALTDSCRQFARTLTWERHVDGIEQVLEQVRGLPWSRPMSYPAPSDRRALLR
jgi:glycosyltransferase involved in cell wall biosynthesis